MKKMLSLLAATLLASNALPAVADPVGNINKAWQKLEEIQMVAALDRAVAISSMLCMTWNRKN